MALSPGRGSWPVPHLCPGGGGVGGGGHLSYPVCAPQAIQLHKGLLCLWFIFPEPLQHLLSTGETGEQEWWGCAHPAGLPPGDASVPHGHASVPRGHFGLGFGAQKGI